MKGKSLFHLLVSAGILLSGCRYADKCAYSFCSECQVVLEDCACLNDTIHYYCPPGTLHGSYSWYTCECVCDQGWTGSQCDQRDTSYNIRFRYGFDSLLLSNTITTTDYSRTDSVPVKLVAGFPNDTLIDSIKIRVSLNTPYIDMNEFFTEGYISNTISATDSSSLYIEVKFKNGELAYSDTGILTLDTSFTEYFHADMKMQGTGQNFYLREGRLRVPLEDLVFKR